MRKKIIAGNWKMNYCVNKAEDFVEEIKDRINTDDVDVVICPNFVSLDRVSEAIYDTNIKLGAQNVYFEDKGAYTGETSVNMLTAVGVQYCIVGHSERRQYFAETNEIVNKKAKKLLEKDVSPIVCVGETLEERENNRMYDVVKEQVEKSLDGIKNDMIAKKVVIAYEPIWSIGTGIIPTNEQIEEVLKLIKQLLPNTKVLYGGSANENNINTLKKCTLIDGYLLGGLSLKVSELKIFLKKLEN